MVVDHIGGPSYLYALTGGNRFYTSAAEAFIFISGLVMGLVYHRLVERDGLGYSLRRAIERSVTLYLVTVTLTLLFIPASEQLNLHWAHGVSFEDPIAFVVSVLTLHQTYYLVDIPLLYTIVLLISPLALTMLSQGRTKVVLGVSWLLWAAYQFFPDQTEFPWHISGNYLFYLSSWQVFFFTGLVLGWHHETLTGKLARFPRRLALGVSGFLFAGLIVLYSISNRLSLIWPGDPERVRSVQLFLLEMVFAKGDVRPGRIIASIVVFGFFYLLVTELWVPIRKLLGWLLVPLGQNALYAYAAHVMLAIPTTMILDNMVLPDRWLRPVNTAVQIETVLLIWVLIRWRILFINPARGMWRYVIPAVSVLLCLVVLPLDPSPTIPGLAAATVEPDPYASRVARAFGTPVPGRPPRGADPQVTLPRPSLRQPRSQVLPRGEPQASIYVGNVRGTFRNMEFFTPSLEKEMPYFVYLPPDYESEGRRYPVLYMLHGNSGSYEEWLAYGLIDTVDRMIVAREILPVIIVLPQGDYSYFVNLADGGPRYADYVGRDLVRHVEATYRVLPGPTHRAIGGLSMGASGALVNAFRNPRVFGIVGAHSPSLPVDDDTRPFLGSGRDFQQRDPVLLASRAPGIEQLTIWIDIGDQDDWFDRTLQLHEALDARGVPHEFHTFPGDHDGDYWATHIPDYLRFYDRALNPDRRG